MKIFLKAINDHIITSDNFLIVKPEEISKIVSGIESFTNIDAAATENFTIQFDLESPAEKKNYIIVKDITSKKIELQINGTPSEETLESLSKYSNLQIDSTFFSSRLINIANIANLDSSVLKLKIDEQNSKVTINPELLESKTKNEQKVLEQKNSVKESLNDSEKTKFDRLEEIKSKITNLQAEVDFYQNEKKLKETANTKSSELKTKKENLIQMLDSVKLLLETKQKLEQDILKFGPMVQDTSIDNKVKNLKDNRIRMQTEGLLKSRRRPQELIGNMGNAAVKTFFGKPVLFLTILEFILAVILFLLSGQASVLIVGAMAIVILLGLLAGINSFKDVSSNAIIKQNKVLIQPGTANNSENEDNFFINAAWVSAIKTEINSINEVITKNLSGKDYSELEKDLSLIDQQEKQAEIEQQELSKRSLTSEEYYKKRRELDILKIEKENLEYTFNNKDSAAGIADIETGLTEINKKLDEASETRNSLPFLIYNATKETLEPVISSLGYKGQLVIVNTVS